MTDTVQPDRPARHARTILPATVHARLAHLAIELDSTIAALLVEGAILVCRHHGDAEGLPEPTPSKNEGGSR
jgi:hypothetical protein